MRLRGPTGDVEIARDGFGVPHVRADAEADAWFGMGYAAAEDRLWQLEYDRLRGAGRWSEAVGPNGVRADTLARRMRLVDSARADIAAMSIETRAAFEAFAAGVNAFIARGSLPPEYALTRITPAPWTPVDSLLAFKIRHVLMGQWQLKLAAAVVLARAGPAALTAILPRPPRGSLATVPPRGTIARLYEDAASEVASVAEELGFVSEREAGSNAWAVHGSRTTTGKPVLCNDSHRVLDVPNVYWQVHVACAAFDVSGATFASGPGFPHFGHNGRVGWAITHAHADTQDLYVERFDGERVQTPRGLEPADVRRERIHVRGAADVEIEAWRTAHGPVVHGDPRMGRALAIRYVATDRPCRQFEVLRPMLLARDVASLIETQRGWVDPVNNLLAADVDGHIGYLLRGELPVRSSSAAEIVPARGWTGECEWTGTVPFERMPRSIDPREGIIASANQSIVDADVPFVSRFFNDPFRAMRILERLEASPMSEGSPMSPDEIAAAQADTVSIPARAWVRHLATLSHPLDGDAERARALLGAWDADIRVDSGPALLYACLRRVIARVVLEPVVGKATWDWIITSTVPSANSLARRGIAALVFDELVREPPVATRTLRDAIPRALAEAWAAASALAGPDPARWRYGDHHRTRQRHPLSAPFPDAHLDPPTVELGGDSDTIRVAAYQWREGGGFGTDHISVYRQVLDLADLPSATYSVPGGASGVPGSAHYADQLPLWARCERIPMR